MHRTCFGNRFYGNFRTNLACIGINCIEGRECLETALRLIALRRCYARGDIAELPVFLSDPEPLVREEAKEKFDNLTRRTLYEA